MPFSGGRSCLEYASSGFDDIGVSEVKAGAEDPSDANLFTSVSTFVRQRTKYEGRLTIKKVMVKRTANVANMM